MDTTEYHDSKSKHHYISTLCVGGVGRERVEDQMTYVTIGIIALLHISIRPDYLHKKKKTFFTGTSGFANEVDLCLTVRIRMSKEFTSEN